MGINQGLFHLVQLWWPWELSSSLQHYCFQQKPGVRKIKLKTYLKVDNKNKIRVFDFAGTELLSKTTDKEYEIKLKQQLKLFGMGESPSREKKNR